MGRQEGIDCLLQAARHIVLDLGRNDMHFGLVGGGTSLEEMKALARELGVADYVTFTGRVPDAELLAMLNTADVCVNPDIANEMNDMSTMNKIMEYMALGKPIVQFDLTEGRFSAQAASLYARRNDAVDLARQDRRAARRSRAAPRDGRVRPPARGRTSSSGATRCRSCSPPTTRSGRSPRPAQGQRLKNRVRPSGELAH